MMNNPMNNSEDSQHLGGIKSSFKNERNETTFMQKITLLEVTCTGRITFLGTRAKTIGQSDTKSRSKCYLGIQEVRAVQTT